MSLFKIIYKKNNPAVGIWSIDESVDELLGMVNLTQDELDKINNFKLKKRKLEFLSVRVLLKNMLQKSYKIEYLETGKPILQHPELNISISHTSGYVAVALSPNSNVGIDIEYPSDRVERVISRFISDKEKVFIKRKQLDYYTLIWCLKETMYKIKDDKNIIFNKNLVCKPFELNNKGEINALFVDEDNTVEMTFNYETHDDFYLVYKV